MTAAPPLRTAHRVFEPQLAGALGWSAAAFLVVVLGPIARVLPPELAASIAGSGLVALALHVALPKLAPRLYPRLLPDALRTVIYAVALLGFAATTLAGVLSALALPRCAGGPVTSAETVLSIVWVGIVVLQPWLFRRSLAIEYLWPTSEHGYERRWIAKLLCPLLGLGLVLASHRVLDPSVWGDGRRARELLRDIDAQPDEAAVRRLLRDESQRLSEPQQRAIAEAAIGHARCDDALLQKLLGVPAADLATELELQRGLRRHAIAARLAEGGQR